MGYKSILSSASSEVFRTLADPTRRALLERLIREGELTVQTLTLESGVSQPAVSKHLGVLKKAKLVVERRNGRQTHYRAQSEGLAPLLEWLEFYRSFWTERLDVLERVLEDMNP